MNDSINSIELLIGSADADHLLVRNFERENPTARDFIDGNWLKCRVDVKSGAFAGSVNVSLRAEAFAGFRDQLKTLSQTLKGNASFIPLEPWLTINLKGDCRHELEALCLVRDKLDSGNELKTRIAIKPDFLPTMLGQLDRICEAFPIMGR